MKKRPDLAILIGHALAKKGASKHDPMQDDEIKSPDEGEYDNEHLQEIAEDMLKAIDEKDSKALADLLREACECVDMDK